MNRVKVSVWQCLGVSVDACGCVHEHARGLAVHCGGFDGERRQMAGSAQLRGQEGEKVRKMTRAWGGSLRVPGGRGWTLTRFDAYGPKRSGGF